MGRIGTASCIALWLLAAGCTSPLTDSGSRPNRPDEPAATPAEMIGQRLMVRMDGIRASRSLLARIRRGEVGGIILFAANVVSPPQLERVTARLQAAATSGGRPPLLIAVDQEGGPVRRIAWAPPELSAREMGRLGSRYARQQAGAAGAALRAVGVNVDLAPVADVPAGPESFIGTSGRAWSDQPARASALVAAFISGLAERGVIAVPKHFPGLGFARVTTDRAVVSIAASRDRLEPGLLPFRAAVDAGAPMVMLANAGYAAWGGRPAGWSPDVLGLLRGPIGFDGVTITDSLDGAAHARGLTPLPLALRAARAGTDMLLITGGEATSRAVYAELLRAARTGLLERDGLERSYRRVIELKRVWL